MFNNILIAVDLDDLSIIRSGLEEAKTLAENSSGCIRLVNVQPVFPGNFMDYMPADFGAKQAIVAQEELEEVARQLAIDPSRLSYKIRTGGIYNEILAEAEEFGADLILLGSHRPNVATYLLGSNATTIVRHAKCSVLVIRSRETRSGVLRRA